MSTFDLTSSTLRSLRHRSFHSLHRIVQTLNATGSLHNTFKSTLSALFYVQNFPLLAALKLLHHSLLTFLRVFHTLHLSNKKMASKHVSNEEVQTTSHGCPNSARHLSIVHVLTKINYISDERRVLVPSQYLSNTLTELLSALKHFIQQPRLDLNNFVFYALLKFNTLMSIPWKLGK